MDDQVARVAEKFRLAGPSGAAAPFGRVGRRNEPYVLNPPLPEADAATFEATHGIRLPTAYRRFLTEIGDGDTTHSGLYSLADAFRQVAYAWQDESEFTDGIGVLAQPCKFRPGETYDLQWLDDNSGPDDRFDELFGTLPVSGAGCQDFYLIVLNGPDTGAVHSANWDGNAAPVRVADDFLTWQESSVDSRVFYYAERWGDGAPSRRVARLVEILTSDEHEYRRMWAALGLRRHRLTGPAHQALRTALADDHYIVRAMALNTVRHHAVHDLTDDVRGALDDPSGDVRYRAFMTLAALPVPDLDAVARAMLADPLPWAREHALRVLRDHGWLTGDDLRRGLDDPQWTVRRTARQLADDPAPR
jgi:SMI1/KNR4 family protein SUKH-1